MHSHRFFRSLVLMALFGLSLFVLAGCAGNTATDQTSTEPASEAPSGDQGAAGANGAQNAGENRAEVDISNFAFSPAEVKIKAGTTILWTNNDGADHQVHDDSNAFKSDILGKGGAVEVNYSAPGTFTYHCHVHSNMKGKIIVE